MKKIFIIFIILFFTKMPVNAGAIITENIANGCSTSMYKITAMNMIPIFQIKTYVCEKGYFLPANTDRCVVCPVGYICNGGTFIFNETYDQGIRMSTTITQNMANGCTTDFFKLSTVNLVPIFKAKTINIQFDDGNGNISESSCTYNGSITLPEEPTRPGYIFKGWAVK